MRIKKIVIITILSIILFLVAICGFYLFLLSGEFIYYDFKIPEARDAETGQIYDISEWEISDVLTIFPDLREFETYIDVGVFSSSNHNGISIKLNDIQIKNLYSEEIIYYKENMDYRFEVNDPMEYYGEIIYQNGSDLDQISLEEYTPNDNEDLEVIMSFDIEYEQKVEHKVIIYTIDVIGLRANKYLPQV